MGALPEGRLTVRLEGSCGQSLGAFGVQGLTLDVVGDANDYVGKGLSGATIVLRPPSGSGLRPEENAIIGNTCLYGATSGVLLASGQAGERFAVRNSGASAVVEGMEANGCEYMTGGLVISLGPVGDNFAAGMTGGMAYVWDPANRLPKLINPDSVVWRRIGSPHWESQFTELLERHVQATGSPLGRRILDDMANEIGNIWQVVPKEMLTRLAEPLDAEAALASA
jgi:glutamate synthase (NADPH/NADH) large chain